MSTKKPGLIGRKLGMTQFFDDAGNVQGVTVVEISPNTVLQVKTADGKDGYNALQLGVGTRKPIRSTKAEIGHARKALPETAQAPRVVREIRLESAPTHSVGQSIALTELFAAGDKVDVQGTSKGRGFAGVMKRHNMSGFSSTHGVHEYYRHGGSIGTRLTPGMTWAGMKMPGHYGAATSTVQNLKVVKVDAERGLLYIRGGVPGADGSSVVVRKSVKA